MQRSFSDKMSSLHLFMENCTLSAVDVTTTYSSRLPNNVVVYSCLRVDTLPSPRMYRFVLGHNKEFSANLSAVRFLLSSLSESSDAFTNP